MNRSNIITAILILALFFLFCSQTPAVKSAMTKRKLRQAIRRKIDSRRRERQQKKK